MKSKEELNALKEEVETVSRKLHELTDEELAQVSGGAYDKYDQSAGGTYAGGVADQYTSHTYPASGYPGDSSVRSH